MRARYVCRRDGCRAGRREQAFSAVAATVRYGCIGRCCIRDGHIVRRRSTSVFGFDHVADALAGLDV